MGPLGPMGRPANGGPYSPKTRPTHWVSLGGSYPRVLAVKSVPLFTFVTHRILVRLNSSGLVRYLYNFNVSNRSLRVTKVRQSNLSLDRIIYKSSQQQLPFSAQVKQGRWQFSIGRIHGWASIQLCFLTPKRHVIHPACSRRLKRWGIAKY
jgi:hypothetical protein